MSKFIDISHDITDGMVTYKGLPAPVICDYMSREDSRNHYDGETFHIGRIDMVVNTGTYMDCPFHRYEDGKQFTEIQLDRLASVPGVLVTLDYRLSREVGVKYFKDVDVRDKAVLVHTGWDELWGQDAYFEYNPYLTEGSATYLRDHGAVMVGIDSLNIDDTRSKARPVHSILLGQDILVIEHLTNLGQIPNNQTFKVSSVPPKIEGVGSFPVRVFVELD